MKLKRRIFALAFAVIAAPAFAAEVGPAFEQTQLDRQLPAIDFAPVAPYMADSRAPYEQLVIDRALPNVPARNRLLAGAALGDTRSDAAPDMDMPTESPWAHDFNFIAPPQ